MKKSTTARRMIASLSLIVLLLPLSTAWGAEKGDATQKNATELTSEINKAVYDLLDFDDRQEFEFAEKGLLAAPETLEIYDDSGKLVWSQKEFSFIESAEAADSTNPSLWRNTQLNHLYGLFEVTDGIYQVRGYDMTNITFIEGDTGWIVFDPLMSVECAQAAMELVNDTLGERPVICVIYSHPHIDHFGGARGIISDDEIESMPIIAPQGFEEHAVSENLYIGTAMGRRAGYQYGAMLQPGEKGGLSIGIGMGQSKGMTTYIPPNDTITYTGEERIIDGIRMVFQMTPGTEAPAEMNTWFPDKKALWLAENCTGTLHNLYTLRGAKVRDGNAWAGYIMEALALYGNEAEVVFQSHNWPHWGNDVIVEYLLNTAAVYKFINDQTLMYINQGYTSDEISNMISLPKDLEKVWYMRQYYGTVAHNAKAVYQSYMGWYDANPVNLNPLAPSDRAKKYVEYIGDTKAALEKARKDFANGEYQWVAEITNVLVFADPENLEARYLCADALEQLGYQAESGTWRNVYLSGALELRQGMSRDDSNSAVSSDDILMNLEPYMAFDYMGIHLDSNKAQDLNTTIKVNIQNEDSYILTIRSGVLLYQKAKASDGANVTVTLPRQALPLLLTPDIFSSNYVTITGDTKALQELYLCMEEFDNLFNIIEP